MEYLMVGAGGMLGAITRYGIGKFVGRRWSQSFPLATFCINITGSFILGLLYILFLGTVGTLGGVLKPIVITGFLGAYTTFSAFSLEIVSLLEDRQVTTAAAYFLVSLVGGLTAAFLGILLGQTIL